MVLRELEILIFERKKFSVDYFTDKKIDLVIGGDKGKEKFRVLMKLLIRSVANNEILYSFIKKVGHINAEKDNFETFKMTIAP